MIKLYENNGITGMVNSEISATLAYKYGQVWGIVLKDSSPNVPKVLVAKDSRASGDMMSSAIAAGLCSVGVHVTTIGIVPTPALSYLIVKYKNDGGIMISAPKKNVHYSGIYFLDRAGRPIDDACVDEFNRHIINDDISQNLADAYNIGRIRSTHTALRDYVDYIKSTVDCRFRGIKIAVDSSNGATSESAKLVFKELGADVEMLHNHPDGFNINDKCGYSHLEPIKNFVTLHGCDMGIAFDGVGIDYAAVDENGCEIPPDVLRSYCSDHGCEIKFCKDAIADALVLVREFCMNDLPLSELIKTEK